MPFPTRPPSPRSRSSPSQGRTLTLRLVPTGAAVSHCHGRPAPSPAPRQTHGIRSGLLLHGICDIIFSWVSQPVGSICNPLNRSISPSVPQRRLQKYISLRPRLRSRLTHLFHLSVLYLLASRMVQPQDQLPRRDYYPPREHGWLPARPFLEMPLEGRFSAHPTHKPFVVS